MISLFSISRLKGTFARKAHFLVTRFPSWQRAGPQKKAVSVKATKWILFHHHLNSYNLKIYLLIFQIMSDYFLFVWLQVQVNSVYYTYFWKQTHPEKSIAVISFRMMLLFFGLVLVLLAFKPAPPTLTCSLFAAPGCQWYQMEVCEVTQTVSSLVASFPRLSFPQSYRSLLALQLLPMPLVLLFIYLYCL